MRRAVLILPLLALALLVWAGASGADARVAEWAAGWQRTFQNALAGALRALRAGEPGAVTAMVGLCFGYGVAHAAGPGHGKVLIGGYGVGRRIPVLRLSAVAMAAALGQAATAIAVVGIGIVALGWTRTRATEVVESLMAPASGLAIGAIGLWLSVRGARRVWRARRGAVAPHHGLHAGACDCGHRHGPTLDEVRSAAGSREVIALVGSIAIRPCSGAVLLLVLTWHMEILVAGIAGTLAMSLGTGAVTVAVAVAAVTAREGALRPVAGTGHAVRLLPALEILAGLTIALVAFRMLAA